MRFGFLFSIALLFLSSVSFGQTLAEAAKLPLPEWVNDRLPNSFHKGRRQALQNTLSPKEVAVFLSYPVRKLSRDINYSYHPNPNVYYLTGIREAGVVVVVANEPFEWEGASYHSAVFVQPKDPKDAIWHGDRWGVEGAAKEFELSLVLPLTSFGKFVSSGVLKKRTVLLEKRYNDVGEANSNRLLHQAVQSITASSDNKKWIDPVMTSLRQIKTVEEVYMMRKAIEISCEGHRELMRKVRSLSTEYEAEAIAEGIFRKFGAEKPAYPSIVGVGPNSCVLHYDKNSRIADDGEFLLIDAGAEYRGYAADVTRCYPMRGGFTDAQRAIYELVLKAEMQGIEAAVVGAPFRSTHEATVEVISKGLVELSLIEKSQDYRRFFMHGTSHYLGLDVHDVGDYKTLQPGMVVTVEPGVYIAAGDGVPSAFHNIGVRIEDDILITEEGPINLSACIGKEIADVEFELNQ